MLFSSVEIEYRRTMYLLVNEPVVPTTSPKNKDYLTIFIERGPHQNSQNSKRSSGTEAQKNPLYALRIKFHNLKLNPTVRIAQVELLRIQCSNVGVRSPKDHLIVG